MHPSLLAPALATSAALALACAHARSTGEPVAIPVSVSSQNRSSVDVYLMCGYGDAQWLGTVEGKHGGLFEIPVARARCGGGLHFFLVHLDWNKGFWVGPLRPRRHSRIYLMIEKYAPLSSARVVSDN